MRPGHRTVLAVLAVLATVPLVLASRGGQALAAGSPKPTSIPPNYDASRRPGNEAEHAIAINPTDPRNIVAMSTLLNVPAGIWVDITFDGGTTWTHQLIGTENDTELGDICCDEQLAWDRFGNLWMTYLHNVNPNTEIAVSTDGGLSFTKVASIPPITPTGSKSPKNAQSKKRGAGGNHYNDQPSIAVGSNSVWVSYTSFPSTVIEAVGARITGPGHYGAFTAPEFVPTSDGRGDYGDTAVGPDGGLMVIYQDATSGQGGSHIYTAVDPDGLGSKGFTNPRLLARSRVGGFDYIPAQPDRSVDAEASLAWDRSGGPHTGRVYAIWTQEVKNESDNMDIEVQHSDDDGVTWSKRIRLNDDHTKNSQFNPAIALDQTTGAVAVAWYDCRNDLGNGGPGDTDGVPNDDFHIWATDSTNGGRSWARNFRVSAGTSNAADAGSYFDTGDYTHAAFDSGRFYPEWSDNSNSTGTNPNGKLHQLDLYTAKVAIP